MSQIPGNRLTSDEEYRNIFEAASDGLVIYDIGLDSVVEANPAACTMHGYTRDEFIGLNPAVFMLPENHAQFREQVRTAEPGRVFEASIVHLRKDGSAFHVEVRRSMILFRDTALPVEYHPGCQPARSDRKKSGYTR
jgi:PAS domain S-box-containing protein